MIYLAGPCDTEHRTLMNNIAHYSLFRHRVGAKPNVRRLSSARRAGKGGRHGQSDATSVAGVATTALAGAGAALAGRRSIRWPRVRCIMKRHAS